MRNQFRSFRRRSGIYYLVDNTTGKTQSLKTRDGAEAQKLTQAHNDAFNQSLFNLALARVYMAGTDPKLHTRTWQDVMEHIIQFHSGETARRWRVAVQDKNFNSIRHMRVVETRPEHFAMVLSDGKHPPMSTCDGCTITQSEWNGC